MAARSRNQSVADTIRAFQSHKTQDGVPHINELLESVIKQFGGPSSFARTFKEEFDKMPEGRQSRAKLLEILMRLIQIASANIPQNEFDLLTDDDLDAEAERLLTKMQKSKEVEANADTGGS